MEVPILVFSFLRLSRCSLCDKYLTYTVFHDDFLLYFRFRVTGIHHRGKFDFPFEGWWPSSACDVEVSTLVSALKVPQV
jgi:hypothetical protein